MSGVGTLIGGKAADALEASVIETVIRPRRGWIAIDWRELIQQRELLYFLTMRDIKVRYKQTVLGVAWAVLQPVLMTVVFTIFMGIGKIDSQGIPEPVFIYSGLLPWTFIATGVSQGGLSLVNQQTLLTKIYLPRLFVPASAILGALVDLAISFVVFLLLMGIYGLVPGWGVLALPLLVLMSFATALGIALMLAALTVTYRDFRYVIPFAIQIWLFLGPVIYPREAASPAIQWLIAFNPVTGIIEGFRAAFLGQPWNLMSLGISAAAAGLLLVLGLYYFRRTERRFADIA